MKSKIPKLIKGGVAVDDRGSLTYNNEVNLSDVKRFYLVSNHMPEFVRAWHGHLVEGKYVTVIQGAAIIGAAKIVPNDPENAEQGHFLETADRYVLSAANPSVLWIPPGYANGWMNLTKDTILMYMSTHLMSEVENDDYRFDWFEQDLWDIENR